MTRQQLNQRGGIPMKFLFYGINERDWRRRREMAVSQEVSNDVRLFNVRRIHEVMKKRRRETRDVNEIREVV